MFSIVDDAGESISDDLTPTLELLLSSDHDTYSDKHIDQPKVDDHQADHKEQARDEKVGIHHLEHCL